MRKDVIAQKGTAIAIMQENLKEMDETLDKMDITIKELKDSDEEIKSKLEDKIDKKMNMELNKIISDIKETRNNNKKIVEVINNNEKMKADEKKEILKEIELIVKNTENELNKKGDDLENTKNMLKMVSIIMIIIGVVLLFKLRAVRSEMDYINKANETVIGVQAKEDLKDKYIEFAEEKGIKYNSLKSTSNNIKVFETFELDSLTDNQIKNGIDKLRTNEFNIEIEDVNFLSSTIKGYKVYLQE
ncbi:MAG: hypothetical protein RR904_06225 [Bacilli bacterium]